MEFVLDLAEALLPIKLILIRIHSKMQYIYRTSINDTVTFWILFFNFSEVNTLNLRLFRDQSTCIQSHILSNWEKWIGHLASKDGDKGQTYNCLHNDRDSKTVVKSKETNWQLFGCSVKILSGCFVQIQERI